MSDPQAGIVIIERGSEVPEWVPASAREEVGEALDDGACVCVRRPFSFWQLSTQDELKLSRWLIRVCGAQS